MIDPFPVSYAERIPFVPKIKAPVGKSGPLINCINPKTSISGLSI